MKRITRWLLLASILLSWQMTPVRASQTPIASKCGNEIVLVQPVSPLGNRQPLPLAARSLDGTKSMSIPIANAETITSTSGSDRVLVGDHDGRFFIADPGNGVVEPLAITTHDGMGFHVDAVVPDSSFVVVANGTDFVLVDLSEGAVYDLTSRIGEDQWGSSAVDASTTVLVSPGGQLVVARTIGGTWIGAAQSTEPLTFFGNSTMPGVAAFSPSGSKLLLEYLNTVDGLEHLAVLDDQLTQLQDFYFDAPSVDYRFMDEETLAVATSEGLFVVRYRTLLSRGFVNGEIKQIGPVSDAQNWIVLWTRDGVQLLDLLSGTFHPLHDFDQFVSAGPVVGNRVVLSPLIESSPARAAIDFSDDRPWSTAHITKLNDSFRLEGIDGYQTHAIYTHHDAAAWTVLRLELASGIENEIATTSTEPAISLSAGGCVAITTSGPAGNSASASIDFYDAESARVGHIDQASFVGWAGDLMSADLEI